MKNCWIAERTMQYEYLGKASELVVRLGIPKPDPEGDWRCAILITVLGQEKTLYAHGVDAFQAVQLAFECVRSELEQLPGVVSWVDGTLVEGFPKPLPTSFGVEFYRNMEEHIEHEAKEFTKNAQLGQKQ